MFPAALENVTDNDLGRLGLPFCNPPQIALTALSVGPRPLVPEFAPEHTEYVTVSGISPITVTVATKDDASSRVLDENGDEIPDADTAQEGHQVEIGEKGVTVNQGGCNILPDGRYGQHLTPSSSPTRTCWRRYDTNGNGTIDRDEAHHGGGGLLQWRHREG